MARKSKVDMTKKIKSLPGEEWKTVIEFGNGIFQVSNLGRVKRSATSFKRSDGKMCNRPESLVKCHYQIKKGRGYGYITMCAGGETRHATIHTIVAKAFIPNMDNKPEINHKDGDKSNNTTDNLEWVTRAENMYHAKISGLLKPAKGANHFRSRKVAMYDFLTRVKLATFESANIAANILGNTSSGCGHILEVCSGKREYAFGYYWAYCEKETVTTNEKLAV